MTLRENCCITTSAPSWKREPSHIPLAMPTVRHRAHAASHIEAIDSETEMIAIAKNISRAILSGSNNEVLKQLALFCGAGLLVSLLLLSYGLDLSPGFF
jgi:hypothetical protein